MDKLLSTNEVAEQLGCTRQWVAELLRNGELTGQMVSGKWVISQKEVDNYKKRRKTELNSK